MHGLKDTAFFSMAEIIQVLSPRVETNPTCSGKTLATLYCNAEARTNPDILDLGTVSPILSGMTRAFAGAILEVNLCFPSMKSLSFVHPTFRGDKLLELSALTIHTA